MRICIPMGLALVLSGCSSGFFSKDAPEVVASQPAPENLAAAPVAPARTPPPQARTAAQFDVTTQEERKTAAAASANPGGESALGDTVASLGDPSRAGFWLETPLISTPTKGRVLYPGSGKSAQVDLIPIEGPATAGSRLSLSAMRLIEAPLTDLPVIKVFTAG
ncbi:hypothetical protein [Puniceibacterium sp. IMCC21224]|uniref:hypothetical protein n=1 Tax=Puniceibacterium sp. IMCC21224 TaxID=1618204 RepID=UPI00064D7F69|nr:hypothetical protein [Puniceibacterium sp. IMCC21224]KMK67048.1 hypothetical protein IMCC21224_111911 [Puniceibacterium sp. IMCC21224]